jgi:hypothetical protein
MHACVGVRWRVHIIGHNSESVMRCPMHQIKAKVAELSTDKKMPASMKKQALKIKEMTSKLQSVSAETIADAMAVCLSDPVLL